MDNCRSTVQYGGLYNKLKGKVLFCIGKEQKVVFHKYKIFEHYYFKPCWQAISN
jgi:hypothetical protein